MGEEREGGDERMKCGKKAEEEGKGGRRRKKDKGILSILLCFLGQLHSPPPHDIAVEGVEDALVCQL